jgi:nucleotide-binding universal stress UspA family protein
MEGKQERPHVIVVGVDYSESCALALNEAFALAAQQGAEPHVVHVAAVYGGVLGGFTGNHLEHAKTQLESYVQMQLEKYVEANPGNAGFERVCTHQRDGFPAEEIVQLAVDLEADLVLVGTHSRRGVERLLLGSVAERVVRIAPCPVLVVRAKKASKIPEIEPVCPRCQKAREESVGKQLWCETHRERHGIRHTYHYVHRNVAQGASPLTEPLTRR